MTKLILWLQKWIFYLIGLIFILSLSFIKGCSYGRKSVKCPVIATTTIIKHDTITHYIYNIWPWYFDGKDSIVYKDVPAKVDTFAILKDYYALHFSNKKWQDSLLEVNLDMMISENKFYPQEFSYKILRAQTIINNSVDNSVTYNKYLYAGASLPLYPFKSTGISNINFIALDLIYGTNKGYFRANWQPYTRIYTFGAGVKLFQFK